MVFGVPPESRFFGLQKDRIGNIIVYYVDKIGHGLSLTKLLKLLYLTDEESVKKTGVPITWLDHNAWKRGPVSPDVFFEIKSLEEGIIRNEKESLDEFISVSTEDYKNKTKYTCINAKRSFDNSEFTDFELGIFDHVVSKYGNMSADKLEALTHKEGSLYDGVYKANNLEAVFKLKGSSSHPVEFFPLIKDDPIKQLAYKSAYQSLDFQQGI